MGRAAGLDEVCESLLDTVLSVVDVDRASLLLFDADGVMRFRAWRGLSPEYREATTGHTPWSPGETNAQPITVPDVSKDPAMAGLRDVIECEGIGALAFIPVVNQGRLLGKFMLYCDAPHVFGEDTIRLAQIIASSGGAAIERRRSEDAANLLLSGQRDALELMVLDAPLATVLDSIVVTAERYAGGALVGAILLLDGRHLRHGAAPSLPTEYNEAIDGIVIGAEVGTCGAAAFTGQPVVTLDIDLDPNWQGLKHLPLEQGLRAAWSTPILARSGRVLGTFGVYYPEPREPSPAHVGMISLLTRTAAIAIERTQAQTDLRERNESLEKALAAKDEFLGMVSHELRTPLTTIFGGVRILRGRRRTLDEESTDELLEDVDREAMRLRDLVEDLLVLARVELGETIDCEPLLLSRILEARDYLPDEAKNREIELKIDPELQTAWGSATYCTQVLRNLVTNALKYAPPGSPLGISAANEGEDLVRVTLSDRGPGLSEEECERIFDSFYRAPATAERAGGVGIGLAVCRRLVEAQGGKVWASPREGGGLEVSFTLPVCQEPDDSLE